MASKADIDWLDFLTNLSYLDLVNLIRAQSKIPCVVRHKQSWKLEDASFRTWLKDYIPKGLSVEDCIKRLQEESIIGPEEKTSISGKYIRVRSFNRSELDLRIKELSSDD